MAKEAKAEAVKAARLGENGVQNEKKACYCRVSG